MDVVTLAPDPPGRSPRNRTALFAWVAVVVILAGVVGLVAYALADTTPVGGVARPAPAPPGVMAALAAVPRATFDAVGGTAADAQLTAPTVLHGQPALTAGGKPEVLYVGSEFCPFCAAERWPLIVALSRFGHFTALDTMQSSADSLYPDLQTFTFAGASYDSRYLTFTGVELYSDTADSLGVYSRLATLTPAQAALVARYGAGGGTGGSGAGGGSDPATATPFVDVADKLVATTSGFSPVLLLHLSQPAIAASLTQATATAGQTVDPTGQAIVASANQLTAGMCAATGQQPSSVCATPGVRAADATLGLS